MNLENVNKKNLVIALVLVILLIISAPYILSFAFWLMLLLFFGMPNILSIVLLLMFLLFFIGVLKFFKSDKTVKKEILKSYFLNIYWKRNLLFLFYFIIVDVILSDIIISIDSVGYPFPYLNYNFLGYSLLFRTAFFIFDILFWYVIFGLIMKQPKEISKNVVKLNYISLGIVLLIMFYYLLPLISKSQIVII